MNHVLYSKVMSVRCCPRNGKRAKHQIHCAIATWEGDVFRFRPKPLPLVSPETGPQHKVTITITETTNPRWAGAVCTPLRARSCRVLHAPLFPADRPEGNAMSIISSTGHTTASTTSTLTQRLTAAVCASILGACLVYFAGFSHIEAVHNAAHDTRHSSAFPCH